MFPKLGKIKVELIRARYLNVLITDQVVCQLHVFFIELMTGPIILFGSIETKLGRNL